ncbi:nitroreductase family protein [Candidatus Bathyarchaeota archaeon]|nr:nitroreductase family protein [Candidatus Bathyarchaeota archaeon]
MIYESIINRRTIRKFKQQAVSREVLIKCVDAARLSPTGGNTQPLKYIIVNDQELLPQVYSITHYGRNIPDFKQAPDEVPVAYIVVLLDTKTSQQTPHDAGIVAMSISMVAYENGVASCIMGSAEKPRLKDILKIPDHLQILLVIALGYPAEKVKAAELKDGNLKYWYDDKGILNVPKRRLEDILIWNTGQ